MTGRYDLVAPSQFGTCPASVAWTASGNIVVAERNDTVYVYDARKPSTGKKNAALKSFDLKPNLVEGCQVSPNDEYLVASTTVRGESMGELRIWGCSDETADNAITYAGHTGPIYQFCFSPDGSRLATGGSDAIVGLWDVEEMVCTHTITRRTKFIRSVSFSPDSQYVASSTEEDGIDIASADDGEWVGTIRFGVRGGSGGGADEICFHPKRNNILACARANTETPVTVAKWSMAQQ
jgi:WD40 repeat protein